MSDLNLRQLQEKLETKQKDMAAVIAQAKNDDGSMDFNKVTHFGAQVKGSIAVAEKFNQMDAELNEIGGQIDILMAAEKAAFAAASREKGRRDFALPGGGATQGRGNYPSEAERFKSLGEMVAEAKSYKDWAGKGAAGGISLGFDDLMPSDFLAGALMTQTIGNKALMTRAAGYAPEVIRLPGFIEMATRPLQMLDIIPLGTTDQSGIKLMEETTRNHAEDFVAEGGGYPEDGFVFTERNFPVEKIGASLPVTDEQLEDAPMMMSYINGRLTFGVRRRFDTAVLIGTGVAPQLRGLKNLVGIQAQAKGADPVVDCAYKGMVKVRLVGRATPTHTVLHPTDWQGVRLMRTVDGVYIWGNPSEAGPERLWGLPVVQQDIDAVGAGYVGSFTPDCVSAFERRGIDVQMGYVGTQFTEGKRTVRADMRMALAWTRPAAFCALTGLNA